ncbi:MULTISPECIES: hypothetical protein [Bacillus amyloliquefaciens group]|uniref:DUF2187 domain-containing protein n=1 Tax=Bacillus velezensis TaxID=492670 RepID=A0ABC8D803_BACVE|nr:MULTISPECIES: hypothetical protein [Bacillus amyloliquefaciens group]APH35453.1 hypothetical protein BHE96_07660 [Bacillus subtilis]AVI28290.1 hypothetical protein C3Z10_07880 [Bacillus velezensis]AWX71945.1 hypothetical protein BVDSYZ_07890 [Bacillus velezensis]MDK2558365.1 hypothetical protein [Bacillus amyloliquefaciens]UQN27483.1 hypothetical protein M2893_07840 [Bacillus velezensis]
MERILIMNKLRKGDKVEVLIDTFWGVTIPKGTIGKVVQHDKESEENSYVEVDFNYQETEARLSDEEGTLRNHDKYGLSYWDIVDGTMIHKEDLRLVK